MNSKVELLSDPIFDSVLRRYIMKFFAKGNRTDARIKKKHLKKKGLGSIKQDLGIEVGDACYENDMQKLTKLLEKGAAVNTPLFNNLPPLFFAAMHNNYEMVDMLLKKGADLNYEICDGHDLLYDLEMCICGALLYGEQFGFCCDQKMLDYLNSKVN